jgi:PPOX class probable F420-dependent enzyme
MSHEMTAAEARLRFAAARVAVLATADATGGPHLVPITFVLDGDTIYSAVDGKPKRSTRLRRHANIQAQPRVSLLVEHWAEKWSRLWWVRADGLARVSADSSTVERVVQLLTRKYDQYQRVAVGGPVIEVDVHTWKGWSGQQ